MSGYRVRVLLEWYDPQGREGEAEAFARGAVSGLERMYPGATVVPYVERNPPPDEVEGLSRSSFEGIGQPRGRQ